VGGPDNPNKPDDPEKEDDSGSGGGADPCDKCTCMEDPEVKKLIKSSRELFWTICPLNSSTLQIPAKFNRSLHRLLSSLLNQLIKPSDFHTDDNITIHTSLSLHPSFNICHVIFLQEMENLFRTPVAFPPAVQVLVPLTHFVFLVPYFFKLSKVLF
jgi:hypothetical protein